MDTETDGHPQHRPGEPDTRLDLSEGLYVQREELVKKNELVKNSVKGNLKRGCILRFSVPYICKEALLSTD